MDRQEEERIMRAHQTLLAGLFLAVALGATAETATYHGTKTLTPLPGGTLKVEGSFQDISVILAPGLSVEVTVDMKLSAWPQDSKEALKAYEPVYSEEGSTLLIRCRSQHKFSAGFFNSSGSIAIRMPPGMRLDLDTGSGDILVKGDMGNFDLACDTGSGDVRVDGGLRALSAETGSGDVRVKLMTPAMSAKIDTGSGDVNFSGGCARFDASAGSGNFPADGLVCSGTFETGSGDIQALWTRLADGTAVKAESGSGRIYLGLPADATLSGDLDTGSGDIRSDYPGTSSQKGRHWSFLGAAAASHLSVETGSGDIRVVKGS
jgi:DUF4097 and DUF4098 domain-containing protein YvlB